MMLSSVIIVIEVIRIFAIKHVQICAVPQAPVDMETTTRATPNNYSFPLEIDFHELLADIEADRPVSVQPINVHQFSYISNPKNMCRVNDLRHRWSLDGKGKPFFLLILIKSSRKNFHLRQTIRWKTKERRFKKWRRRVRIVFLLGYSFNESNSEIARESDIFNDIVQEDFLDTYRNLTYKTVMGYRWATRYCSVATHILFQDDDFHFNVANVFYFLRLQQDTDSVYIGHYIEDSPPDRHNDSKYYMTYDDYPHPYFPPYFPGGAYFISMTIAQKFVKVFPYVKHIAIDDTFLGIVAYKLNVTLHDSGLIAFGGCENFTEIISCRGYINIQEVFSGWKEFLQNLGIFKTKSEFFSVEDATFEPIHLQTQSKGLPTS